MYTCFICVFAGLHSFVKNYVVCVCMSVWAGLDNQAAAGDVNAGDLELRNPAPRRGLHTAQLLAEGAATAAAQTDEIAHNVAGGTSLLAQVIARKNTSVAEAAHTDTVGPERALITEGAGVELAAGAWAKEAPVKEAEECVEDVGSTAAWRDLPDFPAGAGLTAPVKLIKTGESEWACLLHLCAGCVEAHVYEMCGWCCVV